MRSPGDPYKCQTPSVFTSAGKTWNLAILLLRSSTPRKKFQKSTRFTQRCATHDGGNLLLVDLARYCTFFNKEEDMDGPRVTTPNRPS